MVISKGYSIYHGIIIIMEYQGLIDFLFLVNHNYNSNNNAFHLIIFHISANRNKANLKNNQQTALLLDIQVSDTTHFFSYYFL
jgi:hypothetical protein